MMTTMMTIGRVSIVKLLVWHSHYIGHYTENGKKFGGFFDWVDILVWWGWLGVSVEMWHVYGLFVSSNLFLFLFLLKPTNLLHFQTPKRSLLAYGLCERFGSASMKKRLNHKFLWHAIILVSSIASHASPQLPFSGHKLNWQEKWKKYYKAFFAGFRLEMEALFPASVYAPGLKNWQLVL